MPLSKQDIARFAPQARLMNHFIKDRYNELQGYEFDIWRVSKSGIFSFVHRNGTKWVIVKIKPRYYENNSNLVVFHVWLTYLPEDFPVANDWRSDSPATEGDTKIVQEFFVSTDYRSKAKGDEQQTQSQFC